MRGALFITFITLSVNLCLIENTGCFFLNMSLKLLWEANENLHNLFCH